MVIMRPIWEAMKSCSYNDNKLYIITSNARFSLI